MWVHAQWFLPCHYGRCNAADNPTVIGGAQIYSLFLPHVEELWLSHMGVDVPDSDAHFPRQMMRNLGFFPVLTAHTQRGTEDEPGFQQIVYRRW
ncbi:dihydrofolate reductase [Klebsiella pneumoniae]|uniref:dihydrofolate reductase n=1 Tax=Klebsiella pneumoniae TaxID=573 RepID=UPI0039710171